MKILKDSFIITIFIFVLNIVIKLISNPSKVIGEFENGFWIGVGVYAVSLTMTFVIVYLLLLTRKYVFQSKGN